MDLFTQQYYRHVYKRVKCTLASHYTKYNIEDHNNNNIFIHTCYNCIEQYIPINNNILRIIKHVMLKIKFTYSSRKCIEFVT